MQSSMAGKYTVEREPGSPRVGWRLPSRTPLPPSVTRCSSDTLSPITAVSPTTCEAQGMLKQNDRRPCCDSAMPRCTLLRHARACVALPPAHDQHQWAIDSGHAASVRTPQELPPDFCQTRTTPVAWSISTPRPIHAPGWMSTCSTSLMRFCSATARFCAAGTEPVQGGRGFGAGCPFPHMRFRRTTGRICNQRQRGSRCRLASAGAEHVLLWRCPPH